VFSRAVPPYPRSSNQLSSSSLGPLLPSEMVSYCCDECGESFDTTASQCRHKSEHHSIPKPVVINGVETQITRDANGFLVCPYTSCDATKKTRTSMKKHLVGHSSNVPADTTVVQPSKRAGIGDAAPICSKRRKVVQGMLFLTYVQQCQAYPIL
jgi:predicted RNA-binding Zn-ribbon protein involved in translation (DUF1610 family)